MSGDVIDGDPEDGASIILFLAGAVWYYEGDMDSFKMLESFRRSVDVKQQALRIYSSPVDSLKNTSASSGSSFAQFASFALDPSSVSDRYSGVW